MKKWLWLSLTLHCILSLPAIADAQNPQNAFTNSIGISLIPIPAGTFLMGSPETEPGRNEDETLHQVTISKDFYISATEVTQEQFNLIMGYNPSAYQNFGKNHPVEQVSWDECQLFIEKLNQKEKTGKYRLPTEAEWEYACRAGTNTAFASGEIVHTDCRLFETLDQIGWYCGNSDFQPHRVAQKRPNPWGLLDMHGNLQEWCLDRSTGMSVWSRRAVANTDTYVDDIVDPLSRKGELRIFRGGSWNLSSKHARSANRSYYRPTAKRNDLGFRIVKEK